MATTRRSAGRRDIPLGTRVRIPHPSHVLTLRTNTGTVVGREDVDTYLVRLDEPAIYDNAVQHIDELPEILETWDNMEILPGDS
jgi:hypothetical protein